MRNREAFGAPIHTQLYPTFGHLSLSHCLPFSQNSIRPSLCLGHFSLSQRERMRSWLPFEGSCPPELLRRRTEGILFTARHRRAATNLNPFSGVKILPHPPCGHSLLIHYRECRGIFLQVTRHLYWHIGLSSLLGKLEHTVSEDAKLLKLFTKCIKTLKTMP